MSDVKTAIEGLEHCKIGYCNGCPYEETKEDSLNNGRRVPLTLACNEQLTEDILSLLKEQEAVKPVLDEKTGRIWLCGKCGSYVGFEDNDPHDSNEFDKFCRACGRPVLWEGRRSK